MGEVQRRSRSSDALDGAPKARTRAEAQFLAIGDGAGLWLAEAAAAGATPSVARPLIWNQAHLRRILREYEIHHNQHRPHRSVSGAAPLKPLPEPVDLGQYRVRRQTRISGLINEYHLVA